MNLTNPMTQQLIQSGVLAFGLIACLMLFLTLKREVRRNERRFHERMEELSTQLGLAHLSAAQSTADAMHARPGILGLAAHASGGSPSYQSSPDRGSRPVAGELAPGTPTPAADAVISPPRSGFHLNRRSQALRLLRRGEDIAHVAAALGVPRREVELLVRVHQLGASRPA